MMLLWYLALLKWKTLFSVCMLASFTVEILGALYLN